MTIMECQVHAHERMKNQVRWKSMNVSGFHSFELLGVTNLGGFINRWDGLARLRNNNDDWYSGSVTP